ncbi:MAG: hypothetical protein GXO94_05465 [Nitrospirae bacterium]|nr:hypothetical protein [Nitrospirota bacterium]
MMIDTSILPVYTPGAGTHDATTRQSDKNEVTAADVERVAKEFEALFIYELLKGMRSISGKGLFQGGLSGDVFQTLFDMELSKSLAERGTGISDMLVKTLQESED